MDNGNLKVYNEPKPIDRSLYDREVQKYVDQVKDIPGVVCVATMGSIGAPGLSDLDLICIVEDDFKKEYGKLLTTSHDIFDRNILLHGPVIVPMKLLRDFIYIIYTTTLNYVHGQDVTNHMLIPESIEENKHLALTYLIDFSESRLIQMAGVKNSNEIDKRGWLTRLWSFTHTEYLCEKAGIELNYSSKKLLNEIKKTRTFWKDNHQTCSDQEFLNLFHQSMNLVQEVIVKSLSMKYADLAIEDVPKKRILYTMGNKRFVCDKMINKPSSEANSIKFRSKSFLFFTSYMPSIYRYHLERYGFSPDNDRKLELRDYGTDLSYKRSKLVRSHSNFLNEIGASFSMKGYLGLPLLPSGIKMRLLEKFYWAIK
ncbi:hypothetical protein QQ008_09740 [Fulvivirgaceae bacterium BMA10]|uniref:Polymerase nucleotidyl transferase domain-containing protein n=1 Tax=Splendidivirga corallicola TaxID=3051826 RepID=A0ABT8KQ38_9BACT|nr:hypothetical protein [Fulvivirgaceae bacterium BMA10]